LKTFKDVIARADQLLPQGRSIRVVWLAALLMSVELLLLPLIFKLDGQAHGNWQQFLGRFHPLVVHVPIGLILLVPVLEIAGLARPALREAAGFVLKLSFIGCLGALILGYLLAYGGGDVGAVVTRHMWGGIVLTIFVLLCALARPWWISGSVSRVYPALLSCALLALVWATHQGGSLTHGSNYLTQYMPAPMKQILLVDYFQSSPASSGSFYAMHIHPIFDSNCVACHGEGKIKGGLRLDSYDVLMKGGKDGAVIVPGKPESSTLLARVTLPSDHKQFMPADGKPPLKPEQIAWIRAWIQQGASPSAATVNGVTIREESKEPTLQPVGDYSGMMHEILLMQQGQGAKLVQVSRNPADGLVLSTVDVAGSFDDAQLAQFQKYAPYIVEVELGRTAVTNGCFDTLAKFTNLRALHLEGTGVTGVGLQELAPLTQLTYLNLSETKVTPANLAPLGAMKNLRHIYLYNTPAQPVSGADAAQSASRSAL
jgi:mono/diheme cytochrome c family protein